MSNKDSIRRALGLPEGTSDDAIILKLAERQGITSPTTTAEPVQWSQPIDPSAIQPSNIALSEAQTELTGLFKQLTEPSADGMSFAELETMEQTIAKYPHLYDAYRKLATQSG
jgi:hypothetical protein